jgi:uncharacterized RDD family membrane protein YckC
VAKRVHGNNAEALSEPVAEPLPPYASWGRRAAAIFVDNLLLALPFVAGVVLALVVTGAADDENDNPVWAAVGIGWLLWIVLPFVYFTVLNGGDRGQTVGKRLLGIRVRAEEGGRLGYGRAFGRFVVGWVLWLLCYVPGILDALWPLWDVRHQALHDKVANSVVVEA